MENITLSVVLATLNTALTNDIIKATCEIVKTYLANANDCGRFGNAHETIVNTILTGVAEHRKPASVDDIVIAKDDKRNILRKLNIEAKTNNGMFNVTFKTEAEAKAFIADRNNLIKAIGTKYVAYNYYFRHASDIFDKERMFTTKTFVDILYKYDRIRIKKPSSKAKTKVYKIGIQQFMPTPGWSGYSKRYDFINDLLTIGTPLDTFINNGCKISK